ncbi:MAG: DUF6456 domain-containing protein [Parvibaculaceae bacterium]
MAKRRGAAGNPIPSPSPEHGRAAGRRLRLASNDRESPLAWLRSRKDKSGQRLISQEEFEAGERLRADYTLSQLEPRLAMSWDMAVTSGARGRSGPRPESLATGERAMAAKQRLFRALDAAGPELSGILLEVCCLERGLEAAERRLGWPQRSGKLILGMALKALARHYGLCRPAERARAGFRHWGAGDYRPKIAMPGDGSADKTLSALALYDAPIIDLPKALNR